MSKSMLSAGADVRDVLRTDPTIQELVGENIYPIIAPNGTEGGYILYARDDYSEDLTKMGVVDETASIILNANSTDYDEGLMIAEAIRRVIRKMRNAGCALTISHAREDVAGYTEAGNTIYSQIIEITFGNLYKG